MSEPRISHWKGLKDQCVSDVQLTRLIKNTLVQTQMHAKLQRMLQWMPIWISRACKPWTLWPWQPCALWPLMLQKSSSHTAAHFAVFLPNGFETSSRKVFSQTYKEESEVPWKPGLTNVSLGFYQQHRWQSVRSDEVVILVLGTKMAHTHRMENHSRRQVNTDVGAGVTTINKMSHLIWWIWGTLTFMIVFNWLKWVLLGLFP